MPVLEKKPIEAADLAFTVNKLIFAGGKEAVISSQASMVQTETGLFYMQMPPGAAAQVRRHGNDVRQICYTMRHRGTGTLSPIFDHKFRTDSVRWVGGHCFIGPMQLNPAEEVFPELTRKGYYGELPQFYT
jgi:hypothetical protein